MSTASEQESRHERLSIAEAYSDYLTHPPNGMEHDLFGDANVVINAPLALIQCSLQCEVSVLQRLASAGLLLNPEAPAQEKNDG